MKWPFSRNNNVDNVPQEIQEYYQSERRERTGVAWLLALGTLLVTVALATALFFGGRWVYRKVVDRGNGNDNGGSSQVQQNPADNQPTGSTEGTSTEDQAQTPAQDGTTPGNEGTVSDTAATTNRPNVPATGDSLPDTGPGDVLAIFTIVTVVGTLTHRFVYARRP